MKSIKEFVNETTINEAKLNIYTMTAKGSDEIGLSLQQVI